LSEAYPVVPLAEQHALSIGMFSYREHMCFGLYADPQVLPEVSELPEYLNGELAALAAPAPPPPPARRKRGPVEVPRAASSARPRVPR
jgi:hypothetical protein